MLIGLALLVIGWHKTYEIADPGLEQDSEKFWFKAKNFGSKLLVIGCVSTIIFFVLYFL